MQQKIFSGKTTANSVKKETGQELLNLTPVELVSYEDDETGSSLVLDNE